VTLLGKMKLVLEFQVGLSYGGQKQGLPVKTRMPSNGAYGDIYCKRSPWSKGGLPKFWNPWIEFLFPACTKRTVEPCPYC